MNESISRRVRQAGLHVCSTARLVCCDLPPADATRPSSSFRKNEHKNVRLHFILLFFFFLNRSLSYTYSTTCSWQVFMAHPYISRTFRWYCCEVTVVVTIWTGGWAGLCGLNTRTATEKTRALSIIFHERGRGGTHTHTPSSSPLCPGLCYNSGQHVGPLVFNQNLESPTAAKNNDIIRVKYSDFYYGTTLV